MLPANRNTLPKVMCMDEFKGDTGGSKYHLSMLNSQSYKIIDIVKSRTENNLKEYFRKISKQELAQVKY